MTSQLSTLHPKISRHFNLEELSTLCFNLEIDFEELAGQTKQKKVQSFLEFINRRGGKEALLAQLEKQRPNVAWRVGPPADLVNPYKGLNAFTTADAPYFFGRKKMTANLLSMVRQEPFVAVLGASGSGKSSLVFAGLVAQVKAEDIWLPISYRPGKEPFVSMAGALLEPLEGKLSETSRLKELDNLANYLAEKPNNLGRVLSRIQEKHSDRERLLLIIDQFEELYTLVSDIGVRHTLIDTLLAVRDVESARLVITMRADFLGQALTYPALVDSLQSTDLKLGPMSPEELRDVIVEPARKVGINFESGLEERILNDVLDEPGYLPLLQFALTRLWGEQQGGRLTHEGYEEIGDVAGALVQYADEMFESLEALEQATVRQVFTRLVRPGLGTEDTRRVAAKRELAGEWELTQWLADRRLVVTSRNELEEETAEIVHEALIQRWGKLRQWLEEDREFLTWREGLGTAVTQWIDGGHDEGVLLREGVLVTAEAWLVAQREALSLQEHNFIEASIAYREARIAEAEEQRQRELAQAQQIAEQQKKLAEEQRQRAEEKERAARKIKRQVYHLTVALIGAAIMAVAAVFFAITSRNNERVALNSLATVEALGDISIALEARATVESISPPNQGSGIPAGIGLNIAVSEFTVLGLADTNSNWAHFHNRVFASLDSSYAQRPAALSASLIGPEETGVISGASFDQRRVAASAVAERMNVDILIFGVIHFQDADTLSIFPEYYVSLNSIDDIEDVIGPSALGSEIHVPIPNDVLSEHEIGTLLASRIEVLVQLVEGQVFLLFDDYERAISNFESALMVNEWADEDGKETLYVLIGLTALKAGLNLEGYSACSNALEINPQYFPAAICLGDSLFLQDNFEDAILWQKTSLDMAVTDTQRAVAADRLGDTYLALEDTETAIFWYEQAVRYAQDDLEAQMEYRTKLESLK